MAHLFRVLLVAMSSALSFAAGTNDFFSSRIVLNGALSNLTAAANFTGATREPGEPHNFTGSLWWEWTPAFEGGIVVRTIASPTYPAALVYTGSWPNLTLVSAPAPSPTFSLPTKVSFYAHSNITYFIAAAAPSNAISGNVTVYFNSTAAADDFSRAIPVEGTNVNSSISSIGSTLQPGEVPSSTNVAGTVWWKWSVTNSARYVVHTFLQDVAMNLAIYSGDSITNLTRLALATPSPFIQGARATLFLEAGTYYVAAENLGNHFGATLSVRLAPHNDFFADRVVLPSTNNVTSSVPFAGATLEPNEPGRTNASLWWEWTAPAAGSYGIETTISGGSSAVEVYTGTSLTNLVPVSPYSPSAANRIANIRVRAGETVFIRATAPEYSIGSMQIRIRLGPSNDDFSNATLVEGSLINLSASAVGATFEPGESTAYGAGSLWFRWTPTNSGSFSVEARIGGFTTAVVFGFRGNSLTNLTLVTNAYTGFDPLYPTPSTFRVEAGEQIFLQLLIPNFENPTVNLLIQRGPVHDDFANATPIVGGTISGGTRGASSELGEPYGGARGQTVWYRWQPEARGYEIRLSEPANGNVLSLYEGDSLTNLTLLRRLENPPGEATTTTFLPDLTKTYFIAVDAYFPQGVSFSFQVTPGPANDSFSTRTPILLEQSFSVSTAGATREPGEPSHAPSNPPRTLWFEWTAPETAGYYLEVSTPLVPPGFSIYQGTNIAELTLIPFYEHLVPSTLGLARFVTFRATQGEKYLIAAYDDKSQGALVTLRKGVHNDDFANATDIPLGAPLSGLTHGATLEPGEPTNNIATGTLWHRFTAPTNGSYVVTSDRGVTVYRGNALTSLSTPDVRPAAFYPSTYPFRASAGETVYISVVTTFPFSYALTVSAGVENDDFAHRTLITTNILIVHPAWSTLEPGEPTYVSNLVSSVWFSWTPANSGLHRIVASGIHQFGFLAAYRGTNLANLELITSDSTAASEETIIDIVAQAGTEYSIVLNHVPVGDNPFSLAVYTAPAHDNFASPQPISLNESATNRFAVATKEPGETNAAPETVWYIWTAPATTTFVFVPTIRDGYLADISIYTGDALTNLALVTTRQQGLPTTDGLPFRAVEGTTYRIVLGFNQSSYERTVEATIIPGNPHDDFAERARLTGLFVAWTNTTSGATLEPGENALHLSTLENSVWAEWTAPTSGTFKITPLPFISYTPRFSVYRGDSLSALQLTHSTNLNTPVTFVAEQGAIYQIRAASALQMPQGFIMRLGPIATNESPAKATQLEGTNIVVFGQNWTASTSTSGLAPQISTAIWYSWTAPSHGFLTYLSSSNSTFSRAPINAYHTRQPTIDSNLTVEASYWFNDTPWPRYPIDPWRPLPGTYSNITAVTEGITYLFALSGPPATNIHFALSFEPDSVSLGELTNVLLGGLDLWFAQTNVFYSGPEALQAGPLTNNQLAWTEMIFTGPGTLHFRTKIDGSRGSISVSTSPTLPFSDPFTPVPMSGTHDWTQRSHTLTSRTNIVRFTFQTSPTVRPPSPTTATAWLDDIEFIPAAPRQPRLGLNFTSSDETLRLNLQLEAYRPTILDYSTNLVDWIPWTNLNSTFHTTTFLPVPVSTNGEPGFFRARVLQ